MDGCEVRRGLIHVVQVSAKERKPRECPGAYRSIRLQSRRSYFVSRGDRDGHAFFYPCTHTFACDLANRPAAPAVFTLPLMAGGAENADHHQARVVGGYCEKWL